MTERAGRIAAPAPPAGRAWHAEVAVWALFSICVGSAEGGTIGVIVNTASRGAVGAGTLAVAVAVLVGASNFANVAVVAWSALARRYDPAWLLRALQVGCGGGVLLLAGAPRTPLGLARVVVGVVAIRLLWSGLLVLRTSLWRARFGRTDLARLGGRVVALQYLLVAASSAAVGATAHRAPASLPWLYGLAALAGLAGAALHRRFVPRGERLGVEADGVLRASLPAVWTIFRHDPAYRRFLLALFALDGGALMTTAPLVMVFHDVLRLDGVTQTALLTTIPMLAVPLGAPSFARLLGRVDVVAYRARQAWFIAGGALLFAVGASLRGVAALVAGSVLLGLGWAGGSIAWHLGHHEFATPRQAPDYMALNTLLTGLRGFAMPLAGVALYRWLAAAQPGGGTGALFLAAGLSAGGALAFVAMAASATAARSAAGAAGEACDAPPGAVGAPRT